MNQANQPPSAAPVSCNMTALCTVLSDAFVLGFAVLAHSLRHQHPGLDLPFFIIHHPELAPLSPSSRALVSSCYPNIRFHEADASLYQTVWDNCDGRLKTPHRLKSALFALEAFGLGDFDRVVALDSDMVCTGDLSPLFNHPSPFAATRAIDYDAGVILDFFNTGVLVIGAPHLTGETYTALLNHRISDAYETRKGKADQAFLNDFFGTEFTPLDEAYNVTKRKFPDSEFGCVEDLLGDHVRILHFVAEKPWEWHSSENESRYSKLEAFWAGQLQAAIGYEGVLSQYRRVHTLSEQRDRALASLLKEGCALSESADRVVSQIIVKMEELTVPAPSATGLKRWVSTALRSIFRRRILVRTSKAREIWTKHRGHFEAKLAAHEPRKNPNP